jgi:hypothetical protein
VDHDEEIEESHFSRFSWDLALSLFTMGVHCLPWCSSTVHGGHQVSMLWALALLVDSGGMEQRRLKSPRRMLESHRGTTTILTFLLISC